VLFPINYHLLSFELSFKFFFKYKTTKVIIIIDDKAITPKTIAVICHGDNPFSALPFSIFEISVDPSVPVEV
jgi:hypothetical protein